MTKFEKLASKHAGNPSAFSAEIKKLNLTPAEEADAYRAWGSHGSKSGTSARTSSSSSTSIGQKISGAGGVVIGGLLDVIKSQEADTVLPDMTKNLINATSAQELFLDGQGRLNNGFEMMGAFVGKVFGGLVDQYKAESVLLTRINTETGLTGKLSEDWRKQIVDAVPELNRIGMGMEDIVNASVQLITQTGKFSLINRETWEEAARNSKAYVGSLEELVAMFPEFEKIGLGAKNATTAIGKVGKQSLELGLSSQKITKDLNTNIGKLNSYGFKNGIDGLGQMVRKSTEFRSSMENVFTIADKVWNPEGALNLSANLQVIGGAIGDFNDPLKLMYMATNNVEGLQEAFIGAASSLATYNREQGRFEVTGINLRRAKEYADQFGVSMDEVTKTAIAGQERMSAKGSFDVFRINDEDKEFLTNLAQMQNGKMTIQLQSDELQKQFGTTALAIDEMSQNQVEELLKNRQEFQKMTTNDIIKNQATNVENIERNLNYLVALARIRAGRLGKEAMDAVGLKMENLLDHTIKLSEVGGEKIVELSDSANAWMKKNHIDFNKSQVAVNEKITNNAIQKQTEEKNTTNSNNNNTNNIPMRIEHTLNIKSDVLSSDVASKLLREQYASGAVVKSYLNNGK